MLRTTRFRVIMLAVVLGIAVASVAGITFSSTESKGVVTAIRYSYAVRFAIQNDQVRSVQPEVFNLGKRLFDCAPVVMRSRPSNDSLYDEPCKLSN